MSEWRASVPSAYGTRPAATAAAVPLDEPPVHRVSSHGLRQSPFTDAAVDVCPSAPASSTIESLPSRTPPAACSFLSTAASAEGTFVERIEAPAVVGMPFVSIRSLSAYG